jgi:hypothetical protein
MSHEKNTRIVKAGVCALWVVSTRRRRYLTSLRGAEDCIKRNSAIVGLTLARNHNTVQAVATKQKLATGERKTGFAETGRKYRVQVIVTDPEDHEFLNLTKLAFESELHNNGHATPDIQEALQILFEAAGEWSM